MVKLYEETSIFGLFDNPVTAGCPDNDLTNILIALNCDLAFHWLKREKACSLILLQEIIYSLGRRVLGH